MLAYPNAHFSFSFGRSAAVTPPSLAKRALVVPFPQPFQLAPRDGSVTAGDVAHFVATVDAALAPNDRAERNSDTARRSASLNAEPCRCILPFTRALRIPSGVMARSALRVGAPVSASEWQLAHARSYTA